MIYDLTTGDVCTGFGGGLIICGATDVDIQIHFRDHLGSVRGIINKKGYASFNQYEPFGMLDKDYSIATYNGVTMPADRNRFQFNGKEAINTNTTVNSSSLLDYGARMYDTVLGRWNAVDPFSDIYWNFSPYNYCLSNPVNYTDPNGKWITQDLSNIYNDYKRQYNKVIESMKTTMAFTEEYSSLYAQYLRLAMVLTIFEKMINSKMGYGLSFDSNSFGEGMYKGGFGYNIDKGIMEIVMPHWDSILFLHELMHCDQFEDGRLSVTFDENMPTTYGFYDLTDENEAYGFQELFGGRKRPDDWVDLYTDKNKGILLTDERVNPNTPKPQFPHYAQKHNIIFMHNGEIYMPSTIKNPASQAKEK